MAANKAPFLLDTGPLSTLCSFPLRGTLYFYTILQHVDVVLTDGVVNEAGQGKIWRTISPLLRDGELQTLTAPVDPVILDTSYGKDLGIGERSTIKVALVSGMTTVIDDKNAFIVACRFGLRPIGFQDFMVKLVREHSLPQTTAVEIVNASTGQYPKMFLAHTLDMLSP